MPRKLLLADDSITIQKVISLTLAAEDYDITVANDGDAALAKARETRPDIILADVSMPGKNGYEVCEAVKNDPALKDTPVILLAGTFAPLDPDAAMKAGADDNISKPFESEELIRKLQALLPPEEEGAPAAVEEPAASEEAVEPELIEEIEEIEEVTAEEERPPVPEELWQTSELMAGPTEEEEPLTGQAPGDMGPGGPAGKGGAEGFFDLDFGGEEAEGPAETPSVAAPEPFAEEREEAEPEPFVAPPAEPEPFAEEQAAPLAEPPPERPPAEPRGPFAGPRPVARPPVDVEERVRSRVRETLGERGREMAGAGGRDSMEDIITRVARDVVEEVAWEVVPEIAEDIITRELISRIKAALSRTD